MGGSLLPQADDGPPNALRRDQPLPLSGVAMPSSGPSTPSVPTTSTSSTPTPIVPPKPPQRPLPARTPWDNMRVTPAHPTAGTGSQDGVYGPMPAPSQPGVRTLGGSRRVRPSVRSAGLGPALGRNSVTPA